MTYSPSDRYDAHRIVGILFVAVSACGFGALGIFGKLAFSAGGATSTVLLLRFLVGGLFMVAMMSALSLPWPRGRDLRLLMAMGGIGYVGQAFCYFSALRHASAGLTALLLYLYPALVTVAAAAMGRQRLTWRKGMAVVGAITGIFLTVAGGLSGSPAGIAYGCGAAVIYTVYILVGEKVMPRTGAIPAATVIMLSAAVVYGVAAGVTGIQMPGTYAGWMAVAGIAFISTVVAMLGFFVGMQRLGATDAATISTLEPVVTLALAYVVLDESLGMVQLFGAALVTAAVLTLARAGRQA